MSSEDFQRMLQREYYENLAHNITDEAIEKERKYMKERMDKFVKDNNL